MGKLSLEGWVFSDLVGLVDVPEPFEDTNETDDLCLGFERKGVPLGRRGEVGGRGHGTIGGQSPWEDKVGLDNVSNEGGHGNTSVLDLSFSEESDGILGVHAVKTSRGQVQGIPEFDNGVELGGQSFEVGLE